MFKLLNICGLFCRRRIGIGLNHNFLHKEFIEIDDYSNHGYAGNETLIEVRLVGTDTFVMPYCFNGCPNLRVLHGNEHITLIKSMAIYNNPSLEEIVFPSVEELESYHFSYHEYPPFILMENLKKFYMPKLWADFTSRTSFNGFSNLKEVYINSFAHVSNYFFKDCPKLEYVNIENVSIIHVSMFENCTSLRKIAVNNISVIYTRAFSNCISLEELDLSNVIYIGNDAFANCSSLQITQPPIMLNQIDPNALRDINISGKIVIFGDNNYYSHGYPDQSHQVENYAFANTNITSVHLLRNVRVAPYAFAQSKIKELIVEENCIIERFAFSDIPTLEHVSLVECTVMQDAFFLSKNIKTLKIDGIKLDLQSGCFQTIQACIFYMGDEDYYKDSTIAVINRIHKAVYVTERYPASLKTFCGISVLRGSNNQCPHARIQNQNSMQKAVMIANLEITCQECISNFKTGHYLSLLMTLQEF